MLVLAIIELMIAIWLKSVFARWSLQQERFLRRMVNRKSARERHEADREAEILDAKFLAIGALPLAGVPILDHLGWRDTTIWHVWFWVAIIWFAIIFILGFLPYLRAFRSVWRSKR